MRLGWSGWRRWPPWAAGYVGIVLIAGSAMVLLLGVGSCASAYGRGFADLGESVVAIVTLAIGALMMAAGVRMIRGQLSDDAD